MTTGTSQHIIHRGIARENCRYWKNLETKGIPWGLSSRELLLDNQSNPKTIATKSPLPTIMNQKIAAFPYTALDTTKSEIRLINLQPDRVTDGIKCELILASLNDKSTYEALSYELGSPCPGVFGIKLNDQEHFVRENLWLALRCLRLEDGPRPSGLMRFVLIKAISQSPTTKLTRWEESIPKH